MITAYKKIRGILSKVRIRSYAVALFGSALSGVLPAAAWDVPIVLNMKRTALPQAQSANCVSFKDVRLPKRILHILGDCLRGVQTITKQKQKNHAVAVAYTASENPTSVTPLV